MRSLQGIARFVTIAFYLQLLWIVVSIISQVRFVVMNDAESPASYIAFLVTGGAVLTRISIVIRIVCIVAFLIWCFRAYRNLQHAGIPDLKYSPAWAVGGFFVPFLNLVRPYSVMQEVYQASAWLADDERSGDWHGHVFGTRITVWWSFYLTWLILGWMARVLNNDQLFHADAVLYGVVSNLCGVIAIILLIRIVATISEQQDMVAGRTEEEFLLE